MIDKLFPIVKEIRSKAGELHFRRWRILELPRFRIYLHKIYLSDDDAHMHDHPWNFISIPLRGGYSEKYIKSPFFSKELSQINRAGKFVYHHFNDAHKITILPNTKYLLSIVIAWGKYVKWGYRIKTNTGYEWVEAKEYRKLKRLNKLES